MAEGVLSGTPIATPRGWVPVEELSPGDLVLTFDDGPVPLFELWSQPLPGLPAAIALRAHWPLDVPVAALGNRSALRLLPEQHVLIECDAAEEAHGEPFALVPAAALEGYRGIGLARPEPGLSVWRLGFPRDQVVYAGRGALIAAPAPDLATAHDPEGGADRTPYPTLPLSEARALVACLMAEDLGTALRPLPQDDAGAGQAARFSGAKRP
ncbi:Hint domain-containing protein [Aliigemmobacter aestuarii]|uniref:Hint domain-containing protein n=1 Tax=Aliigemmobacter aestuarii TaxID=1445661 RepID=UPI001454E2A7|nr:Hint domain-containing protein [Gemmobacter aestuarii]